MFSANRLKSIPVFIFVCALFATTLMGCSPAAKEAVKQPVNLAAESALDVSQAYLHSRNLAEEVLASGNPEQQKFVRSQVNPKLNKAQTLIPAYDRAVAAWQRTGQGQVAAELKKKEIDDLLDAASGLLVQLVGEVLVKTNQAPNPAKK